MSHLQRATVFGGSGFIGRYVVRQLAERGISVTVVGRNASSAVYLKPMGDVGQIRLFDAPLNNENLVAAAMEGSDAVVNLTGILAESGRQRFDEVHHQGPALVARLAVEEGVERLLHVSAIGADPQSPSKYARSKAFGEEAVQAVFPSATILRPSIVFGPEDQFFNRFAAMARQVPFLPLIGGGNSRFQPAYVGDIAAAVVAALHREDSCGRIYELGGPRIYSFKELMTLTLREIGERNPSSRLMGLPFPLASFFANFAQFLPGSPLTPDQVSLLRRDNVVGLGASTFADLDIAPTAAELVLPAYLARFRRGGWYANHHSTI